MAGGISELVPLDEVGPRLGDIRRALSLTQTEVAQRMNASQPVIARLEKAADPGSDAMPNVATLERYASALGCNLSVLVSSSKSVDEAGRLPCKIPAGTVSTQLADLRKSFGLWQKDVAAAMYTTQPVVARFEAASASPNLRTLERYAAAIGVDLRLLVESTARR